MGMAIEHGAWRGGGACVSDAYKMRAFLCDTRTWGRGSAPLERGHRPCRLSWDKKVVVTGFCHSRVPSKGGTEVHCHSGDSFLSVSLMLLLGSCIFTKIPALLDCGYIPTVHAAVHAA